MVMLKGPAKQLNRQQLIE